MGGVCSEHGKHENTTKFWPENLGCRREDNIKTDLKEIRCEVVDWIQIAQNRYEWQDLVKTVINLRLPQNARNLLTS
jgi:hypothetical protein